MKFSIRDLLLVTVIVALAVGWACDHWQYSQADRELLRQIKEERSKSEEWQSYPPMSALSEDDPSSTYYHGGDTKVIVVPNSSAPIPNPSKTP